MKARRNKEAGQKTALVSANDVQVGTETITSEDVRLLARIADGIYSKSDFYTLAQESNTHLLPKLRPSKKFSKSERGTLAIELIKRYGLDTLWQLHVSVSEADMVVQMAQDLVRDYECQTASEKAMAQVAANAFARIMESSRLMDECSHLESTTQLHLNYISVFGKELDRATRQFDTAVNNLMRMKSPAMKVSVTAKTAFVGNNQQFNANHANHENVKTR